MGRREREWGGREFSVSRVKRLSCSVIYTFVRYAFSTLLINRLHPSGSSPFYQLICSVLASLIFSPCNLDGLQCTCPCALSVLSCFCTDHSGLLSCKLFCFGCCRLACSARSPGRAFTVAGQSVHSSCVHRPPHSFQVFFQSSSFFQNFPSQLSTYNSYFSHFLERTEITCASPVLTLLRRSSPMELHPFFPESTSITSETLTLFSSSSGIPPSPVVPSKIR